MKQYVVYSKAALAGFLIATSACANQPQINVESANSSNTAGSQQSSKEINKFSFWVTKVDRNICTAEFDGSDERFVQILPLNAEFSLLQIACDLGAYQDSHLNYLINPQGAIVREVTFAAPIAETPEQMKPSPNLWGSVSAVDEQVLELVHLSAGTGACGFRALYQIDQVINQALVEPSTVYADSDCYNGITVPHWPQVHFQK